MWVTEQNVTAIGARPWKRDKFDEVPKDAEIAAARRILATGQKNTRVNPNIGSSYALKELVERLAGCYVSNGAFIVGALREGYRCALIPGTPNVWINMKKSAHDALFNAAWPNNR